MGEEKIMDKFFDNLMESRWFVRVLALLLALLLYTTAYIDEQGKFPSASSNTHSDIIEDVPVLLYYDEENFVVTGAPQTVNVYIEGPNSIVQSTKTTRDFTVYLDLTDVPIGNQRVEFQIRDISDKLTVRIEPKSATVNVQEKVTKEFGVEVQFNKALLEEGYVAGDPVVKPKTVKITGGKDVIERIRYVTAIVEQAQGVNQTFTVNAPITVLDENLDKLDVLIEPDKVEVTIPVDSPQKTVPISVKQEGTPKDKSVVINNIVPLVNEVILYGKQSELDKIKQLEIPVDVSGVSGSQEASVSVPLSDGIYAATPEKITVRISAEKKEESTSEEEDDTEEEVTRTIRNVPIEYNGLNNELYVLDFLDPNQGQVDITVKGPPGIIDTVSGSDFKLSINVNNLTEGTEQQVNIEATGPENVDWELKKRVATVKISEIEQ